MKICLTVEGCYPYVVGGVSSWVQMLITEMPEHEFIIYAIGAEEKNRGKFNYTLPKNVIEVKEFFLDIILNNEGKFGNHYRISAIQRENLKNLIVGDNVEFGEVYKLLRNSEIKNVSDFFMSKDFFEIVMEAYEVKYSYSPFTEFFWTVRSMLLPLFYIINNDIPEADIYHSVSTGYAGIVGGIASSLYNKPFILTEHGIYTREREEEIIKAKWIKSYLKEMWINFYYSLSRSAYKDATQVISLFNKNKEIQIELGCDPHKIWIISNGIDIKGFSKVPKRDPLDKTINIGAVARVAPIKDIKTMLESFAIVSEEIENCNFYIIGPTEEDEEYYKECLNLVNTLDLNNITFTGKANVKDYLGKLDIMVLSSISEGQPLTILEGMACKKPQVSTDVGSCRELIYGVNDNFGEAGIVVTVMNYVKLGEAIIKLCKDKALRIEMGENGYKRVCEKYTLEGFINRYKNIYTGYEGVK